MKAGEAVLMIIQDRGGQVSAYQFAAWLGQLTEAGFLELASEGEGAQIKFFYKLTDKGQAAVNRIKV